MNSLRTLDVSGTPVERDVLPRSSVSSTSPADSIFKVDDAGLFLYFYFYLRFLQLPTFFLTTQLN